MRAQFIAPKIVANATRRGYARRQQLPVFLQFQFFDLTAYSPGLHRIMAVLDDRPEMIGRAIDGVRVIGPPDHLEPVVNESAEHGIRISQVIVGGDPEMLSPATLPEIRRICDAHEIRLDFIPELIGLQRLQPPMEPSTTVEAKEPTIAMPEPALSCSRDSWSCLRP
jgi:hypothetical protein